MPRARQESPLLFAYRPRQNVLFALAHLWPLRVAEALELGNRTLDTIKTLGDFA